METNMFTKNERILIKEFAKKIISKRTLTEAFKSTLMRDLSKLSVPYSQYSASGRFNPIGRKPIAPYLRLLGIRASEITDNQIGHENSGGITYSKQNPERIVIIYQNKDVVAILTNGKHIRMSATKAPYDSTLDTRDPKYLRNNTNKFYTGAVQQHGGSAMSDKTGISSYESMSSGELNSYPFYYIDKNGDAGGINQNYKDTLKATYSILDKKKRDYSEKIKQYRSNARKDSEYPKELLDMASKVEELGNKITEAVSLIIKNPKKYKYEEFAKKDVFGTGRNMKVYKTSYVYMYTECQTILEDANTAYKNGDDYRKYTKQFNFTYSSVMKGIDYILNK